MQPLIIDASALFNFGHRGELHTDMAVFTSLLASTSTRQPRLTEHGTADAMPADGRSETERRKLHTGIRYENIQTQINALVLIRITETEIERTK